jgi:glycosyltransferase involved in cell wall biosynthesis
MTPQVSVIVPNYNHALYLEQRINSVLEQTYQNFELIILDDCSTDNSRVIIENFRSHPKVSCIEFNEQNSGSTFKQWDKGIKLAKGEWIWIAESDDWCEPNLLFTLVRGIKEGTSIAFCQSLVVNEKGKILWHTKTSHLEESLRGDAFVKGRMLSDNAIVNASMCIFRKNCYNKAGTEFSKYRFCGDWLFWIAVALQGDVFISGCWLNYFRKHDKDVSNKAYSTGVYYSEYIQLLESLEAKSVISRNEKQNLLLTKFRMFLNDGNVDSAIVPVLKKRFVENLKVSLFQKGAYRRIGIRMYAQIFYFHAIQSLKP